MWAIQELWCCGRRSPPGVAAKPGFGALTLESAETGSTAPPPSTPEHYVAPVHVPPAPVTRQSWINATIEREMDLNDNTRRKSRVGSVSNVVALTTQTARATVVSGTLEVPSSNIRGSKPQSQCEDFGIGPCMLIIPDNIPSRYSTRSESMFEDPNSDRKSVVSNSGSSNILQETAEDINPNTRRRTLSGSSASYTEVVAVEPSAARGGSDFGVGQVEEKVEVLNVGTVRRTTRKSTVASVHSLQAIREVPEERRDSLSGGDFGIQLNSSAEALRELEVLEQQVEVLARKEKVNRLTAIRYQVKAEAPVKPRRNSAPGHLLGLGVAKQTEAARKRERAKTTLRFADKNGGGINFAELAALAAAENGDSEGSGEEDDEAEKAKMAAARNARSRQHTVNHSGAALASKTFDGRRRFQSMGPSSANHLKPRGSISGPVNPFGSGFNNVERRHTTYSENKTSKELSQILKLVPLKKVKVVESTEEWGEEDDDDQDTASPEQLYEQAQSNSQAREKRLTFANMALEQEQPLGDAEVELVEEKKEWGADDSDEEVNKKQFDESVTDKREKRRTMAQTELEKDLVVADAEVELVPETSEWIVDSDDEEDRNKQVVAMHEAREKRRTIAETVLQLNQVVPDAEVEVLEEDQEWTGGADLDDDDDGIQREKVAASAFQAREKRLTVAADEIQKEVQLADAELAVKTEEKEWAADTDSEEEANGTEAEKQRERRNSACFNAREKRLTIAADELQKELIVADVEVDVKEESKEWDADAESDEDIEKVRDKRNTQAFELREKRLTLAAAVLEDEETIIGDAEMTVNEEAKEWPEGGDSDEETTEAFEKLATRASVSFNAREQRITMAALALEQEGLLGDAEVGVVTEKKEWATDSEEEEDAPQRRNSANTTAFEQREKRLTVSQAVLQQTLGENGGDNGSYA